jgi:segregation and condensation protein A
MDQPKPSDFESVLEDFPIRLLNFEGPLDLLLHLIKKHEVNVYDIPISLVTQQYLDYLDLMQEMNLEVAGEFLVMAATLIHIKSRMLAAAAPIRRRKIPPKIRARRSCAGSSSTSGSKLPPSCCTRRKFSAARCGTGRDGRVAGRVGEAPEPEIEVDLFSLMAAFRQVLERARQRPRVILPPEQMPIEPASNSCWRGCPRPTHAG